MEQDVVESYGEEPMSDSTRREIARAVIACCVTGVAGGALVITHTDAITHWLGCHAWQIVGVGGLLVVRKSIPQGWRAYQEIVDFREGLEERRANRRLQDAAIARMQAGTPTKFQSAEGVTIESGTVFPPRPSRGEKEQPAHTVTGSLVPRRRPSPEECAAIVERNSLSLCFGRSLTEDAWITDEITDNHLKIIGASRKGKSCLAAAILDQIERTHDRSILQFALLDLERKTSRLFERSEHIFQVADVQAQRMIPAIAQDVRAVAHKLGLLRQEMDRRYGLPERLQRQLPHVIIYLEEFLEFKRRIRNTDLADALNDVTSLATRGLKVSMHLLICAQVDYADEELRDAMAQFVGDNFSFAVRPEAGRAAGFLNNDLLQKNFANKEPGVFVAEIIGGSALGIAPEFDVKAKLRAMESEDDQRWGRQTTPLPESTGIISGSLEASSLEDVEGISGMPALFLSEHASEAAFIPTGEDKMLNDLQVQLFTAHYRHVGNIADALAEIRNEKGQGLGKRYYRHASWLVRKEGLRG